ncbi:MAG: 3-deoxy-D-manno-octulosonic acid transferase [Vicinamibacteria bacterium]
MAYLLYSFLYGCALLLSIPYFLYRSRREPALGASLRERFRGASVNPEGERSIWIHAVSVGEVIAAAILVPRLKEAYPRTRLALSVTTPTGRRVAEERLTGVDDLFYCPFDLAFLVRRTMARVRPKALIVIETEIWPNLLREARRAGAVTMLVNGRISDRSFPGYLRIRFFLRRYLREFDRFLMQDDTYARRIAEIGATERLVRVTGSLKFDAPLNGSAPRSARLTPEGRRILIGGSTLDPEERILLSVFERLRRSTPGLFLVLAPRHVPRFDEVYELARSRGLTIARRSRGESAGGVDVLLLDTLGELASIYAEADIVFVGGSLASWGGHNIIEPASLGKPVLFGPHMHNFADIARLFLENDAAVQVKDEDDLERALRELLARPERCGELSKKALDVVSENRGAATRSVAELKALLP